MPPFLLINIVMYSLKIYLRINISENKSNISPFFAFDYFKVSNKLMYDTILKTFP